MLVEQAIYTSAQTARQEGYHLTSASPGLKPADAQTLATWCPSHGAMLDQELGSRAISFFELPSGAFALTVSTLHADEYSGRGLRVHTHIFVVPAEVLARFANNPFSVLRAAEAGGHLDQAVAIETRLESIQLLGRARAVQEALIDKVLGQIGMELLGWVLAASLKSERLAVVSGPAPEQLFETLLCLLPIECRTLFSFTTGLQFSAQRPFRLMRLLDERAQHQRLSRDFGLSVVDLQANREQVAGPPPGSWAEFVLDCLAHGGTQTLATHFAVPRAGLTVGDLPKLASQLACEEDRHWDSYSATSGAEPASSIGSSERIQRFDGARPARGGSALLLDVEEVEQALSEEVPVSDLELSFYPSDFLEIYPLGDELVERFKALDEAVSKALAATPGALNRVGELWAQIATLGDPEFVDQFRLEYLRNALHICETFLRERAGAEHAACALDVVCVLFGDLE